jgi:hypothetical protein
MQQIINHIILNLEKNYFQNTFQVLNLQDALSFLPESCFPDGPLGEMSHFTFRISFTSQRTNLIGNNSLFVWLVADGWFVLREKYCWLVADKPNEQGEHDMNI